MTMTIPKPSITRTLTGGGNTTLAFQEWGNPRGTPILCIHAFLQSHLAWLPQVDGPMAERYRVITFDLRGHGDSEKSPSPDAYNNGDVFADDVKAVIDGCALHKPIVIAWSLGGVVIDRLGQSMRQAA